MGGILMSSFFDRVEKAIRDGRRMCDQGGFYARGYSNCDSSPYHGEVVVLCNREVGLFVVVRDEEECVRLIGFKLAGHIDGDLEMSRFLREIHQRLISADITVDETGGA